MCFFQKENIIKQFEKKKGNEHQFLSNCGTIIITNNRAGGGDNLDYGDYYRPVQVIDYANNANVAPKVIEYGHKPVVSDDFKPVKVINYDHVTKVGQRAPLAPLERQRRGKKRRERRKQQREERLNQSGLAQDINQQVN